MRGEGQAGASQPPGALRDQAVGRGFSRGIHGGHTSFRRIALCSDRPLKCIVPFSSLSLIMQERVGSGHCSWTKGRERFQGYWRGKMSKMCSLMVYTAGQGERSPKCWPGRWRWRFLSASVQVRPGTREPPRTAFLVGLAQGVATSWEVTRGAF